MQFHSHGTAKKNTALCVIHNCGLPVFDNNYFDTEIISKTIPDMKRDKAADIDGLSVGHLQYSHPVLSVLLSKLFKLIVACHSLYTCWF